MSRRARTALGASIVVWGLASGSGTFGASASEGPTAGGDPVSRAPRVDVVLALDRRQRALARFARSVSDPSSGRYGAYLRPGQVGRRFGARRSTRTAVRSFLRRRGINSQVDVTKSFVEALVKRRPARRLFGRTGPSGRVPGALRGRVRRVMTLDATPGQFLARGAPERVDSSPAGSPGGDPRLEPPHVRTGTPAGCEQGRNATFTFTDTPGTPVAGPAFTPNQLQSAYGAAALQSRGVVGSGVRAAIYGAGGFGRDELKPYAECFGLEVPPTRLTKVGLRDVNQTSFEAALDLQMLSLMAPGLERLTVYEIGSGFWPVGFAALIDRRNAPDGQLPHVISVSQGDCETDLGRAEIRLTEHVLAATAAAGITVAAGSSDAGSFCPDGPGIGFFPSSSRWMTSVGGTSFTLDADNRIVDEIAWNDIDFSPRGGAAGGGFSRYLKRPSYQSGLEGNLAAWGNRRGYPDVAMIADSYPGIATYCGVDAEGDCDPGSVANPFQAGGGTSYATPLFAGVAALADEHRRAAGLPRLGFANPLLYELGREGGRAALRDVVEGSILLDPSYGCCEAAPGYDLASGWGSVNAEGLAAIP